MKAFECDECGNLVFFENVQCVKCQTALGFLPDIADLSAVESGDESLWRSRNPAAESRHYRSCQNQVQYQVCNWLVPVSDNSEFCQACRLNQIIPDLTVPGNRERWLQLERAKRRLLYTLIHPGLPTGPRLNQNKPPLRFNFVAEQTAGPRILTGHSNGLITIN